MKIRVVKKGNLAAKPMTSCPILLDEDGFTKK